jgi:hypothetical protein
LQECHTNLAVYFLENGETGNAMTSLFRAREYSTPADLPQNTILSLKAGVLGRHDEHVEHIVRRAFGGGAIRLSPAEQGFCSATGAICDMRHLRLEAAARRFLESIKTLNTDFTDVIHPEDALLYCVLCGLATINRSTLKAWLFEDFQVRAQLDRQPDLKHLVTAFAHGEFGKLVTGVRAVFRSCVSDEVVGPVWKQLEHAILNRIVVEVVKTYSRVTVSSLAKRLGLSEAELSWRLVHLIESRAFEGKLDSAEGVLVTKAVGSRALAMKQVVSYAEDFVRETKAAVLCSSLTASDLRVQVREKA